MYDLTSRELQRSPPRRHPEPTARRSLQQRRHRLRRRAGRASVDVAVVSDRYNDQLRFFAIDPAGAGDDSADRGHRARSDVPVQPRPGRGRRGAHRLRAGRLAAGAARRTRSSPRKARRRSRRPASSRHRGTLGYADITKITMPGTFRLPDGRRGRRARNPASGRSSKVSPSTSAPACSTPHRRTSGCGARGATRLAAADPGRQGDRLRDPRRYDPETEECEPVDPDAPASAAPASPPTQRASTSTTDRAATGYVLVSSQGDGTFAVYDRQGNNRPSGGSASTGSAASTMSTAPTGSR